MSKQIGEAQRARMSLELSFAATCIGNGLTSLRAHDFTNKGQFFSGMVTFSVGLERVLKLTLLLDSLALRGRMLDKDELMKIGHDLQVLIRRAIEIAKRRDDTISHTPFDDSLIWEMLRILTTFAKSGRYSNLDFLTAAAVGKEPLAEWEIAVAGPLLERHYRSTARTRETIRIADLLANKRGFPVAHVANDGTPITRIDDFLIHGLGEEPKRKYTVLYLVQIVEFCVRALMAVEVQPERDSIDAAI